MDEALVYIGARRIRKALLACAILMALPSLSSGQDSGVSDETVAAAATGSTLEAWLDFSKFLLGTVALGAREVAGAALQVREDAAASLGLQAGDGFGEEAFVVHDLKT